MHRRSNIVSFFAVQLPTTSSVWLDVSHNLTPWGCKWGCLKVELAEVISVCEDFGV